MKENKPRKRKNGLVIAPPVDLRAMISETAYYRAKKRGFAPGYELEDWLMAEREVLTGQTA